MELSQATGGVMESLGNLETLIGDLVDTGWHTIVDEDLLAVVRRVESCARRVHAASLSITRVIDDRGLAGERGAVSTPALLRQLLRVPPDQANRRAEVITSSTAQPQTEQLSE